MAKQTGLMKLEGTISGLVFYKSKNVFLVRAQESGRGKLIKSDPRFVRVRENSTEFVNAVQAGKLLRYAVHGILQKARDNMLTPRLTQLMSRLQKLDVISSRGSRNAGTALMQTEGMAMLNGFEFNINGQLNEILHKGYHVDGLTGEIIITALIPMNDLSYPKGAGHLRLSGAIANVDFAKLTSAIEFTNTVTLPIDNTATNVTLTPAVIPAGTGTQIILLKIEFLQAINGSLYQLKNEEFNGMRIVAVK